MIGIPLGLAYAHLVESLFHRHVLHGLGKRPGSFWSFHWAEHHREARRHAMVDAGYRRPLFGWHPQTKERLSIAFGVAVHLPLAPVAPLFVGTVAVYGWLSAVLHERAHTDPGWARSRLPWHYDHHMGPEQDANWGIVLPWYDLVVGTRRRYVGTTREARDASRVRASRP